jgi:hypothetical protein
MKVYGYIITTKIEQSVVELEGDNILDDKVPELFMQAVLTLGNKTLISSRSDFILAGKVPPTVKEIAEQVVRDANAD